VKIVILKYNIREVSMKKFRGSIVALVTPFKNGRLDRKAIIKLIDWHIMMGTHGLVVCGTTGEASTLSFNEHLDVIKIAVSQANGRIPIIAGTGSNSTSETIWLTKKAQKIGVDGALVVTPYYNRPTQEGIYLHYRNIAESTDLPLILYNVPSRTGFNMLPSTVVRLSEIKNIVGLKEACGDMTQVNETINRCPKEFRIYSGNDFDNLKILVAGGWGMISVTGNVFPSECARMYNAWLRHQTDEAEQLHNVLEVISQALFLETNPIMVKSAMAKYIKSIGIKEEYRLPLCPPSEENRQRLVSTINGYISCFYC
jgi:4-hydroxy-tetrahydrodipicolinate synthase